MEKLLALLKDEEAPTAVEYAIMVALIAVVIIVVVTTLGHNVSTVFNDVATAIPAGG